MIDCVNGFGGFYQHLYGLEVMTLAIPGAIGYTLWRIFVTNRKGPGGTTILGLHENSETYTEVNDHEISWRRLLLYGLAGFVFAFEVFQYVVDLLSA